MGALSKKRLLAIALAALLAVLSFSGVVAQGGGGGDDDGGDDTQFAVSIVRHPGVG